MSWMHIADTIFAVRPWFVPILAALYLVPIVRCLGAPLEFGGRYLMPLNRPFGQWEHLVMLPRDTLVACYLVLGAIWHASLAIRFERLDSAVVAGIAALLIVQACLMRDFRRTAHLKLIAFAARHPEVHPQEFFDHLLCSSGMIRHCLPKQPFRAVDHTNMGFRSATRLRFCPLHDLIAGAWSTAWLTRLILMAARHWQGEELRAVGSAMALIWAARTAQLIRAEVTVEGRERLTPFGGPEIYLFNHPSFLDFALSPVALSARSQAGDGPKTCLPSFLIAKDHFRDNPLYYRVLGIGRAAEALGMIFVERGREGNADRGRAVAEQASEKLAAGGGPLAIFPQGTRSLPCVDARGNRLDSAYYTVGPRERIMADGRHLKKGAAHIAVETARKLSEADPGSPGVRLVPVAIFGTGIACPRREHRLRRNCSLRLSIGEPIVLTGTAAEADKVHQRIDTALKTAARVHATLERRFFEDIRGMLDSLELEEISLAMKPWRGDDFLFHAVLDAIYACPPAKWRMNQGELIHLTLNFAPREQLLAFKGRVAGMLRM